ncbi:hypothetical protein H7X46_00170 [Pseudonocardia sp. C8]|uniref:hypothetical protein n=1 Tax=Pseudonocardia sp. C8 TaxID=2762759 RepID=UPI0016425577|nr:hypothetical protein [Pseudonocardia sp. C8]MBC3189484.1 hypothetical protein [Pseudonocardia sp. C8]
MDTQRIPTESQASSDDEAGWKTLKTIVRVVGSIFGAALALAGATALISLLFDTGPKIATAPLVGAETVLKTPGQADMVSGQLIAIAERRGSAAIVQGKYAQIRITAERGLVKSTDTAQKFQNEARMIPPHIELPTTQCPQNPGKMTTLKLYLIGENVGSDNIGYRGRNTVSVEGAYELSNLKKPEAGSRSTYCWIDAYETAMD